MDGWKLDEEKILPRFQLFLDSYIDDCVHLIVLSSTVFSVGVDLVSLRLLVTRHKVLPFQYDANPLPSSFSTACSEQLPCCEQLIESSFTVSFSCVYICKISVPIVSCIAQTCRHNVNIHHRHRHTHNTR